VKQTDKLLGLQYENGDGNNDTRSVTRPLML